ncbi:hypothetical protein CBR_g22213 [Chara braunii]|uniref:DUF659 domain-containing protein n=1 Tax=Chara braunii TaxID=69332 RepID=A0A388L2D0_CHABU|nr:hypothetical protein CBR_g22213 [Chara braunii]|eukprot:GBG76465.1 hypothetical protein CBR_g22213 [Chara braunii]
MSQDRGKDSVDSLTTARQGHNTKTFDSPFKVDPTVDGKRDDPVWHFQKDESVKHIFWIPCVAHIMDLILEDIGGIDWVASRISQARLVKRFFKRYGHAREVFEAHSTRTLLLPAEMRFGTNVIMMERLVALQAALTDVVANDRWCETVWSTSKIRKDAAEVTPCIGSPPWWEDLRALCKMLEPIMGMLKLVDNDTRRISKILRHYEEMIASCLSACRDIDREQQDAIVEVFHRRRTMFKTPANTAAMLLDPEFRDATLCDDAEVQQALVEALVQFGYPEDSPQHREVQREDPVAVSEDEMGDPSNETQRDPVHAEELASNTDVIVMEEDTGFKITHPRSPAPVVGTEEETEFRGPGPLRQAQTRCTPAGAPVHSTGAGLEDGEARREPPPHTSDGGLEEGEVAPTPTCGKDGEDERPPTDHHVGLDCPPDSLPPTDELFTMDSALASLPDISLLISPTLPVVAPPEPARRDDAGRDRGFDEFDGDMILHPLESGTPAIFHVGAPWAVEQGLAEEVARNRRGGPHVAAQRSLEGSLEAVSRDFLAQGGHGSQLLSDGVSSVHPPEEGPQQEPHRGPAETLEARPPGVIRSDAGESVSEDTAQPGSADGGRSFRGGIERRGSSTAHPSIVRPSTHDVGDGHTDEPRPHLTGMRDIMCPPPSRPSAADPATHGQAAPSALPTRSFYDGAGMDRRAGDIGQTSAYGPADVPSEARSIGNVDGTCHDSMRAYEEQHGRPIRSKTSDVNDTRTTTARLSRARKKGTGVSIPYHRRRLHPFFRNRDETKQMSAAADGQGGAEGGDRVDEACRGEKRRGGTIILHDDSSTAAEGGETTGADDPDDSDYVPRICTADGDDGEGRRVRMRTGPVPDGHCTPAAHLPPIDRRAQARSLLRRLGEQRQARGTSLPHQQLGGESPK